MLESLVNNKFEYKKLTESEQKARGILGRLVGPIADTVNPTRNGRKYSTELWENVFENPIMKEKISNRVCFGELGHPADRTETDMEKIAICLAEQPKVGKDGKIYGVFDILSTPNGRILKALCDYGCNIGISSRGQGDLITDAAGEEAVDPDTYDCECWDAVLVPGVEAARLKYVTESLHKEKTLKLALRESLNSANETDRKIMEETLSNLNIEINESVEKEIKLEDCTQLTDAKAAKALANKLKARWAFGAEPSMGVDTGAKYFEMFTKDMDLYVHEAGKDSICFGVKKDGTIYGPFDVNDKEVKDIKISVNLNAAEPAKEDAPVEEALNEAKESEEAPAEDAFDDLAPIDAPEAEEADAEEDGEEVDPEEAATLDVEPAAAEGEEAPEEGAEEDERSDEEIFLDFLAQNFDEDKVKEVAKILDIEILDDEGNPITDAAEEGAEEDSAEEAEEAPDEDIEEVEDEGNEAAEGDDEAVDEGLESLVSNLKEAVKAKSDLENEVRNLQERLAASDARVDASEMSCNKLKEAVARLSAVAKSHKDLTDKTSELQEALTTKEETIKTLTEQLDAAKAEDTKKLNESLDSQNAKIASLTEQLNESKKKNADMDVLTEKLDKQTALKESYKKLANKAVNKYIEVKADVLGLTPQDIKRKLGESYTMEDVDAVCEDLKKYYFNVSNLPFSADRKIGVRVNEAAHTKPVASKSKYDSDDDVDDTLIRMARFGN